MNNKVTLIEPRKPMNAFWPKTLHMPRSFSSWVACTVVKVVVSITLKKPSRSSHEVWQPVSFFFHRFLPLAQLESLIQIWYNLGALYESCNDQMLDAIDAYQRAAQLDGNNAHINQRLAEIKHHQDTGGPLGSPPTPRDMSHTSANWPLPNTLNGGPEQYFGSTGSGTLSHSQDDPHRPTPPGPIPMSPTTNTQHSASTHAPSPLTSRPNGVRPGTATSSVVMRPQSAGPFGHVAPPPQSVSLNGSHLPSNQHHPSAHSHPSAVPHTSSHSSTIHRRQSGGYAHLAPMDFEPSPHVSGRAPLPAQHNLPHIRSVVDSQSRGPSPAPAPENLRRGTVMAGPGSRELISPRTSPSIRSGPGPASNERGGGGYPSNNSAAPSHSSSHPHPGPPPYSRYPSSHPILDDAPPPAPPSNIGTNNLRDRSSRDSTRFRHHSPEYRGSGPSERGGRSPPGPGSQGMYPARGEFGGPGYNIPPQPQHQSPYDPRHASSPNMRGPPSNLPRFSPTENGQSPTWSSTDLRSGPGSVYAPGPPQDERRPPSQPGYAHHHSQSQAPPPPSVSHHHSQPPPRRYDPRFDEGPVGPPPIRHSVPNEHTSPHRPSSTGLGRSNAEMEAVERQRSLGPARHAQPSPTPSTELSSTATRRAPRSKPTAANQSRQKEEEGSPVPQVRRRKPNGLGNGRSSQTQTQSSVAPAGRSPPVSEPTTVVPVSAPKERRERKKVGSGGSNGAKLKTKLNESVRGPSPVTVVPTPIPITLPDRKVDEEFEEYDEVADALLSFAGQPRRQVGSSPSDESGKKSPGSGSGSGNTLQDSRSGSSPKVTVPLPPNRIGSRRDNKRKIWMKMRKWMKKWMKEGVGMNEGYISIYMLSSNVNMAVLM
ncbi:hypothetical protein CROQUDRAFT_562525 [Cronartium quercuum f. sp. fusiforme G11]|uniref:Uncharacterized protein n=1 Tax=Cronartium quercuum f. sp. fusiforme G11 TaxID=708437 RepID=A0A9P6TBH4_9BASI|nr:hypothetical protein CROQUDRAFT_562525 [Cronartium quercuum f. sp. fusiforme G11]